MKLITINETSNVLVIPKKVHFINEVMTNGYKRVARNVVSGYSKIKVIGKSAFENFSLVESVDLKKCKSLEIIQDSAFKNCRLLRIVELHRNVLEICSFAFENCVSLTKVTLLTPSKLRLIGESAFFGCSLEEFIIPNRVTDIHQCTFAMCPKLHLASMSNHAKVLDGVLYSNDFSRIIQYPISCNNKTFVIPLSTQIIMPYSFANSAVEEIIFHEKITSISEYSFTNSEIRILNLPCCKRLYCICERAFMNCKNLFQVDFRLAIRLFDLAIDSFRHCTNLKEVFLPPNIHVINNSCFRDCTSLTDVIINIDTSLECLGQDSFRNTKLSHFYIPQALHSIGVKCFADSLVTYFEIHPYNSHYIFVNGTVFSHSYNSIIFYCSALPNTTYTIFHDVFQLRYSCFFGAKNITEIIFNDIVTTIMEEAISNTGIRSITLPLSTFHLRERCFAFNLKLEIVSLSCNVKIIPKLCFEGCCELSIINMASVEFIRKNAFMDCTKITCICTTSPAWEMLRKMYAFRVFHTKKCYPVGNAFVVI